MRRALLLLAMAVGAAACGGTEVTLPTSSPSPSETPSASPSPDPTSSPGAEPSPRPIPPAWALPIELDVPAEELPEGSLVPAGAQLTERLTLPAAGERSEQVAVAYVIGEDPFAAEHGFAVWQRFPDPPAWSVVYAFVDPVRRGVLGIRVQSGDLTGDGHDELLTFEETGGSGACGRWRVITADGGDTREIFGRKTCDAEIQIADGALELRQAVYEPGDSHCCPSAFRYVTLGWNGEAFAETDRRLEPP